MFRSLATRLTAAYVFAAIVLVVIVFAAVTAFALSAFGIATRDGSAAVTRQVPDEVRMELLRHGSLEAAAPDLARHLWRPGLHVAIFRIDRNGRRFLAATGATERDGRPSVIVAAQLPFAGGEAPPHVPLAGEAPPRSSLAGETLPRQPLDGEHRRAEAMAPFPYGLNALLRLAPQSVNVGITHVTVFPDPAPLEKTINAFWLAMLPIGAFVIVAAWLLGRTIAGQALRPLEETTASLNRFGAGDFTPRPVHSSQRNEIGALVAAYNSAAAQVSAAFEERRAAEAQMRQFVADAGHELRTPLTVVMGFLDVLMRRAGQQSPGTARIYDTMLAESRRMRALIDKLIVLARLEHPYVDARERETFDLADVARRAVGPYATLGSGAHVGLDATPDALVAGDENELYDALVNLVENALKYAPGAPVDVRVRTDDGAAFVDVIDGGPGIPADEQAHIFDRFYRGRGREAETEGFGLGLAIAKRAVERAGGQIEVSTAVGHGSRFTIRLPRATAPDGTHVPTFA